MEDGNNFKKKKKQMGQGVKRRNWEEKVIHLVLSNSLQLMKEISIGIYLFIYWKSLFIGRVYVKTLLQVLQCLAHSRIQ